MSLARSERVRTLLLVCGVLLPVTAAAEPVSLWEAELQLGYGVTRRGGAEPPTTDGAMRGGDAEMSATTTGPLVFSAIGSVAVSDDPPALAFGGLTVETLDRSSVGVIGGIRLEPTQLPVRLRGGGIWMFVPETLWGAQASIGSCLGHGTFGVCADIQVTSYFGGTGLPNDETELQVQLAFSFVTRGQR